MLDNIAEMAARLYDRRRNPVHIDIALVAYDDTSRCVIQNKALRHIVQGGVEPVLFLIQSLMRFLMLPGHPPDDQQ